MSKGAIFAGPAAIAVLGFYYVLPFAIVAGAPDPLASLRPFLILSSVLLIALGFYQSWRQKRTEHPLSKLNAGVLWFSASIVLVMMLFP